MANDSNINYLERVERHRLRLLRRQRDANRPQMRTYETGTFVPRLARSARQKPLDEFVIEDIKEGAQT